MNSNYTISQLPGADYQSFTDAVAALSERGVCGPVTFHVASGEYLENINIHHITGTSVINTVTFTPDSSGVNRVLLKYAATNSSDNYVVNFEHCSYIIMDGINMQNAGSSFGHLVTFKRYAHHITIKNGHILGVIPASAPSDELAVISCGRLTDIKNNVIENNVIEGGSYGIYYSGYNNKNRINHLNISNNYIKESYYCGIYINCVDSVKISGNRISSLSNYPFNSYGMKFTYSDQLKIIGNVVQSPVTTWPTYALHISGYCNGSPIQPALIANNMLHSSRQHPGGTGLYFEFSNYTYIVHNNIGVDAISSGPALEFKNINTGINLYNNNILNYGNGRAVLMDTPDVLNVDYNNLASNGPYVAERNGIRYATLADWKTITSLDSHSVSVNYIYTNMDSMRTCDSAIAGKGTYLNGVPQDIDDEVRNTTAPDIGADEFSLDGGILDIGPDKSLCGDSLILEPLSTSTIKYGNYVWSNGAGTPRITIGTGGTYHLTLDNGCGAISSDTIEINGQNPVPEFEMSFTQGNTTAQFLNTSQNGQFYHWDFGDGQTSGLKDPTHTYAGNGAYEVVLTVGNDCDTVSITKTIVINWVGISKGGLTGVHIYPIPATDHLVIQFPKAMDGKVQYQLLNSTGQIMENGEWKMENDRAFRMDVSKIPMGLYVLKLTRDMGTYTEQVLIE